MNKVGIYCTGDLWQSGGGGVVVRGILDNIRSAGVTLFVSRHVELPLSVSTRFKVVRLGTPRNRMLCELYDQIVGPFILVSYGIRRVLCLNSIVPLLFPWEKYVFFQMRMFHFEELDSIKKRIKNALGVLSIRASRKVFVASNDHKSELVANLKVPGAKVETALLGFSIDAQIKSEVAVGSEYMLFVSVLRPYKNLHALVDAYIDLCESPQSEELSSIPELLVVGGVPEYVGIEKYITNIKSRIARSGYESKIKFLGPKSHGEVISLLRGARLFVFPSLFEGFGLPVLEAMALGVPTVCSKVHSIPEVGGDAVMYFNPNSVSSMRKAIRVALVSYPDYLVERAKARAAEFTWCRNVRVLERVLFEE